MGALNLIMNARGDEILHCDVCFAINILLVLSLCRVFTLEHSNHHLQGAYGLKSWNMTRSIPGMLDLLVASVCMLE